MNNVSLIGRLTADIEIRKTANGKSVTNFCIAVNRRFQKEGEQTADFINCVAWNATADFIGKYFNKGDSIALVGEIQTRTYDNNDGQKVYVTEVLVNNVEFCGGKKQTDNTAPTETAKPATRPKIKNLEPIDDDELPF